MRLILCLLAAGAFNTAVCQMPATDRPEWKKDTIILKNQSGGKSMVVKSDLFNRRTNMVVVQFPDGIEGAPDLRISTYRTARDPYGNFAWGLGEFREYPATPDPHSAEGAALYLPVITETDFDVIQLFATLPPGTDSLRVILWRFHIPVIRHGIYQQVQSRSDCMPPEIIPQSVWRQGLDAPKPGRTSTPTHHCIVHHSASNTYDTNYTQVVRAYYVYHTTVNGWDDIGYNYLVAPNGLVYAGRDPEKPEISQDEVTGAHFCGKNSYTMGVCVIGDYKNNLPSDTALLALRKLLSWKVFKDNLNVTGQMIHPPATGSYLPVIAGHKDGCATECPGNNLYVKLEQLRSELIPCSPTAGAISYIKNGFYQIKGNYLMANKPQLLTIYSQTGQLILSKRLKKGELAALPEGMMLIIDATSGGAKQREKIFIAD